MITYTDPMIEIDPDPNATIVTRRYMTRAEIRAFYTPERIEAIDRVMDAGATPFEETYHPLNRHERRKQEAMERKR